MDKIMGRRNKTIHDVEPQKRGSTDRARSLGIQ